MTPKNSTPVQVINIKNWADKLIYIRTNRPKNFIFTPGQFARISTKKVADSEQKNLVWRAQSLTSGPMDEFLEFFIVLGNKGKFSQDINKLNKNDILFLDNQNYGFLTLDRFSIVSELWLFASGSGIAPFLSILKDLKSLKNTNKINVVHSITDSENLAYYNEFLNQDGVFNSIEIKKKLTYLPIVTQEFATLNGLVNGKTVTYRSLKKRFTLMLASGELEKLADCELSLEKSKIMICGNPKMIRDARDFLKTLGFITSRRNNYGHITVENYW